MFDKTTLELYKAKGLITEQKHNEYDLFIYNYSPKAQYERFWDEVTKACRGLILDGDQNIVARPFPKFFNSEEVSRSDLVWKKPFKAYEKMDGSLGILYPYPSGVGWGIATRGSFHSDQAVKATKILNENYPRYRPPTGYTTLFEIIYPTNRIVIDYGKVEDLYYLALIHNETGRDGFEHFWDGPYAKKYNVEDLKPRDVATKLDVPDDGQHEGFVLLFDYPKEGPNYRIKVKLEEYKRLHRIVTQVSSKTIWNHLANDLPIEDFLDRVPDEFYDWVNDTVKELKDKFNEIYDQALEDLHDIYDRLWPTMSLLVQEEKARKYRKEFAKEAKTYKNWDLLFGLLDKRSITDQVWKRLKPAYERPFARDIDDT